MAEEDLLYPWFIDFKEHIQEGLIKSNSERDVFRVESGGNSFIIKYSHPSSVFQKTRSSFYPKLESEYESIELLEKSGVSVVKACGWGSCGPESMLITEEVLPSESVRSFWFSKCMDDEKLREEFLAKFADFLKTFFDADIYHPDFHPGNILLKTDNFEFILVDPYGVEKMEKKDKGKIFEMLCILGAFRGEIHDEEGRELIKQLSLRQLSCGGQAGVPSTSLRTSRCPFDFAQDKQVSENVESENIWTDILKHEALKSERLWQKRKDKALTDLRNSQLFGNVRIRKNMNGEFFFNPEQIPELEESDIYSSKGLPHEKAEQEWLTSLRMQIHRLPHKYPVVWIRGEGENDKLYIQRDLKSILSEDEIKNRFDLSGIQY